MIINVLRFLEITAEKYPEKVAFADQYDQINYTELRKQAKAIGSHITRVMENKTKQPVVVLISHEISSIISFLGVLYSGNFYIPIDHKMPVDRIRRIFDTIKPAMILSTIENSNTIKKMEINIPLLLFEDSILEKIDEEELNQIRQNILDTDPIYAVFTSGSSGTPKGVLVSHRSVINLIEWYVEIFEFSNKNIFGNQSPLDYTGVVNSLYSTLKTGATMHIIPKMFFSFPLLLIRHLNKLKINTIIWTTSALRIIAMHKAFEKETPKYLKQIFFTGEVMSNKILNYFRRHLPNTVYINLYGSTETTCNCTYYIVNRVFKDADDLPIGKPFPNTEVFLLNEENQLINNGEIGEICIKGASLALGYYNNRYETDKAFTKNPLKNEYQDRIFRSGDLARLNEFGEFHYVGRKDNQIKHMGYRIELGEIEAAANSIFLIDDVCCFNDAEEEKIVLCYQAEDECNRELLLRIKEKLPKYMLPNIFKFYENFPLKSNLKVDRKKLEEEYFNDFD